jgi:1-acyl-sn-glycerol-3-phosphate acyltransferase
MAYRRGSPIVGFAPSFLPFQAVYQIIMVLVRMVNWLFYRIRISGREHLKGLEQAILVSNHTLIMDPAVIAHAIRPRRTYFTMLEETALIPFLGTFVRLLGALPIPEGAGSLLSLQSAAGQALSRLGLLHFFPEGECYRWSQEVQPLRPGAFLLACRLGLPVVPITTVLHERQWRGRTTIRILGRTIPVPPVVTVVIGKPLHPRREAGSHELRGAALSLSVDVRERMQAVIDRLGGSRGIYRGRMPRLVRKQPVPTEQTVAGERRAAAAI